MTLKSKNISSSAIMARHLDGTLIMGYIPIDVLGGRVVGSTAGEDWGNATVSAGYMSSATAPFVRNISTSVRAARVGWSSGSLVQLQLPTVVLPPDFSSLSAPVINVMAGRAAAASSDTSPAWNFQFHGSTSAASTTSAAITAASSVPTQYTATVPTAVLVGYPNTMTVLVHPLSSQDANFLYSAWITYTRVSTGNSTSF